MGAYPSVVSSLTSAAIQKDIKHLKNIFICIDKSFQVETTPKSDSVALVANDGKLTLMLVQVSSPSQCVATALVMDESDIKTILKRQKMPSSTSRTSREFVTATVQLPGGSTLVLVPPSMMGFKTGRQQLVDLLADCKSADGIHANGAAMNGQASNEETTLDSRALSITTAQQQKASSSSQQTTIDRSKLPTFPTLDFRLLQKDGQLEPNFPLNTQCGVPFETDLFQGKVLFICRPAGNPAREDPFWNERIFKDKQRRVIVQVQGKFKQQPRGILYAGGEISDPMKLGLLAKG